MKMDQAKLLRMGAVAMCAFALAACGGSDDDKGGGGASGGSTTGGTSGTTPPASIVAGKVDAQFVPGTDARYASMGLGTLQGKLDSAKQEADGAYLTLGAYRTTDAARVGAKSGNAAFAMGSWAGKIVNDTTGIEVTAPNGLAYVVYNRPQAAASDGTLTCTPHLTSPRIATGSGETLTGTATMTITNGVVAVSTDLKLKQASGNETPMKIETDFALSVAAIKYVGLINTTPRDLEYSISLGAGSNDNHIVVVPWKLNVASGAQYGTAVLDCKRPA